jgi:hypothetical protein
MLFFFFFFRTCLQFWFCVWFSWNFWQMHGYMSVGHQKSNKGAIFNLGAVVAVIVGFNICNQCLSPLMLWVQISIRAWCTTLCDKVWQWLATVRWFSPCPLVSSTNKTEILLKVALNTIKQTNKKTFNLLLKLYSYQDRCTFGQLLSDQIYPVNK